METHDFSIQKQLFEIAYQILEDYEIEEWSFGGGTAFSYCYYQHRMSYDIDIFLEDFSAITFNQELDYLNSYLYNKKEDLAQSINSLMIPNEMIRVAVDDVKVVAFDQFIEAYREVYEEVGSFDVAELLGLKERRSRDILKILESKGYVQKVGKTKGSYYVLREEK